MKRTLGGSLDSGRKSKSPAACHEGISGSGDVRPTIRSAAVAINPSVEKALSTKRLDAYRQHSSTEAEAWALYRWNIEVSAAVLPMAADLEVTRRNTIHDLMAARFGREDWWASPTLLLDDVTNEMLTEVVRKYRKKLARGTVGPGRVVADTMLGLWVHLLSRGGHSALGRSVNYEARLWRPTLRFGFSTGTNSPAGQERRPPRAEVHRRALMFQRLRNRAVHHEPLFKGIIIPGSNTLMPLDEVWERSIELLGWMCPDLAALHRESGDFAAVLARRPAP